MTVSLQSPKTYLSLIFKRCGHKSLLNYFAPRPHSFLLQNVKLAWPIPPPTFQTFADLDPKSTVAHTGQTQYTYQKHNTLIENTIHLSKTRYIYRKHNTFTENTIHLSKTRYIYGKHNTFTENTIHLPKTQYIYRKQDTFMENTIHLPKTQYIYRKHYTLIENKIHLSQTQYIYRKHNKFSKTQYTCGNHNTRLHRII